MRLEGSHPELLANQVKLAPKAPPAENQLPTSKWSADTVAPDPGLRSLSAKMVRVISTGQITSADSDTLGQAAGRRALIQSKCRVSAQVPVADSWFCPENGSKHVLA